MNDTQQRVALSTNPTIRRTADEWLMIIKQQFWPDEWIQAVRRHSEHLFLADGSLGRIADALERISPPPPDRSKMHPAGPEALSRPTLADQAQWEKDDAAAQRDPLTSSI